MKDKLFSAPAVMLLAVALLAGVLLFHTQKNQPQGTVYTGTSKGYGGTVTVRLVVKNGEILRCTAEGLQETPEIGGTALAQLAAYTTESGTIPVEGISGATLSSKGFLQAAQQAMDAAGISLPGKGHPSRIR